MKANRYGEGVVNKLKMMTGMLLAGWLLVANQSVRADSLQAQRARYGEIKLALDQQKMDKVAQLMPGLRDYPLYPYLQYRQITGQLKTVTAEMVNQFISANAGLPVIDTLISRFVNELARRKDWRGLLEFSPAVPVSATAQCNYYTAQWQLGRLPVAWQGARSLWLRGQDSLSACRELFTAWRASGDAGNDDYQQFIMQGIKANNFRLVADLARQMLATDKIMATAVMALSKAPDDVLNFARQAPVNDFSRELVVSVFARLAAKNLAQAQQILPLVIKAQKLNQAQRQPLDESLAWRLTGNNVSPQQAQWRDDVIARSGSLALTERRIRLALADNDWPALAKWLAFLSPDGKQKEEWRYWQAMVLQQQGRHEQAQTLLRSLTQLRGFYPMLAAQQLGEEYIFKIDMAPEPGTALLHNAALARVHELKYWQQENNALSEWRNLVQQLPPQDQAALARYAEGQNWWDLSVQATIIGKLWDHLEQRFPLAYHMLFRHYLTDKTIPLSYAMAIARQESAWNPQALSPAGAVGLMQLMPATAQHTARKFHITDYSHTAQLQNPAMNIELGTRYLQDMYQQFGANRILASAAYNAGPGRVRSWLNNSADKLNAVAFIESIPFAETRGYVKNSLAYDAYYRYFMGMTEVKLLTDAEWQRAY